MAAKIHGEVGQIDAEQKFARPPKKSEVEKILAWLGFAQPLPRLVDSRPQGSAFDAFPTSAKPLGATSAARPLRRLPAAHPTPDLRKFSEPEEIRPTP